MGKAPAFQFYPNDWSRDLEEHPLEIEGAWIRICCKLWWAEPKGKLTRTLEQWAKILRQPIEDTKRVISYISEQKIGDVSLNGGNAKSNAEKLEITMSNALSNGEVTVISRRMFNDNKDREFGRLRQRRFKERIKSNAPVTDEKRSNNAKVTESSSSSSSTSTSKRKNILSDDEWTSKMKDLYPWINWDDLNRDIDAWLLNNPTRKKTRRLFLTFISNRQKDKPMPIKKGEPTQHYNTVDQAVPWIKEAIKEGWK